MMAKIPQYIAIIFGIIIVALLAALIFIPAPKRGGDSVGNPSSPDYAVSSDGHVTITSPAPGAEVASPVTVGGSVTGGGWFFEGSFPINVVDADGTVLGGGQAVTAVPGEWTSTGTVLFSGIVPFSAPHSATGTIVFYKDNPSGSSEHKGSLSIQVRFGPGPKNP